MSALSALLDSLIDYAGLFPPAKLPMAEAVRNHATYLRGPHVAYLGRFIVPVARLAEFETTFTQLSAPEQQGWQLSVLAGPDPATDSISIQAFATRHPLARIVAIETKAATPADVARLAAAFPPDIEAWIEVPATGEATPFVAAIQAAGRREIGSAIVGAKIRTGGVTPDAFPPASDVARFMRACRTANVIFKATAGLHHPLRGEFPLTYEAGSLHGAMFGFLNIFLAATLIHSGGSEAAAIDLLAESGAGNFTLGPDAITWNGQRFTAAQLTATRKSLCRSFGSCSFTEPIEGLQQLHWL